MKNNGNARNSKTLVLLKRKDSTANIANLCYVNCTATTNIHFSVSSTGSGSTHRGQTNPNALKVNASDYKYEQEHAVTSRNAVDCTRPRGQERQEDNTRLGIWLVSHTVQCRPTNLIPVREDTVYAVTQPGIQRL